MMKNNSNKNQDQKSKVEVAKRIADQSQKGMHNVASNVEETIFRVIRWCSSLIDQVIFATNHLNLVALVLAIFLFASVNYDNDNSLLTKPLSSAKTLSNISMSARYNSESFEISGLPSSCEVVLTGDAANVNNAATKNGYCQVDLDGFTEGTHSIKVKAVGYGDNVQTTVTPSETLITLKRKTTGQFEVSYDYINVDKMDSRYILDEPEFIEGSKVNIRASQDTLNSIALVKALIDVGGKTQDFETNAKLVVYDKQGRLVDADIVPHEIKVKVGVSSPHKTVPIVLNVTGDIPDNMAIDSIAMDHQTATIYANEKTLSTIESVVVNFDASTLTRDTKVAAPIELPNGVTSSDIALVNLDIKLAESTSKVIEGVSINYRNNLNNYSATVLNNQTRVDVEVIGTASNIDKISANDLFVYIDLIDLAPGTYDLPLNIESMANNSYVKLILKQLTLNITLEGSSTDNSSGTEVLE